MLCSVTRLVSLTLAGRSLWSGYNATDILKYFIRLETGDKRFANPSSPIPEVSDYILPLQKVYSQLFSIWLALNKEILLVPTSNTTTSVQDHMIYNEERIFVNKTLFIISETILGIYIIVAIIPIAQRPPKFLPRQPTTIPAMISYFAASTAVRDLKGTSHRTTKERIAFLKEKGFLYRFGRFVGPDGNVHVGIKITRRSSLKKSFLSFHHCSQFQMLPRSIFQLSGQHQYIFSKLKSRLLLCAESISVDSGRRKDENDTVEKEELFRLELDDYIYS